VEKIFFLCRRKANISHERFAELVLNQHVPLALKHHQTMRRYEINVANGTPDGGEAYDSLPSLHFEAMEDYRERLCDSKEGARVIAADTAQFMGGSDPYCTHEQIMCGGQPEVLDGKPTPGTKWVVLLQRKSGMSHEEFLDHWRNTHAPLVLELQTNIKRYATNDVIECLSETAMPLDGIAEMLIDGDRATYDREDGYAVVDGDLKSFCDTVLVYPVTEYIQK
jgi:uncharacterized protein (TIGR02118 family)